VAVKDIFNVTKDLYLKQMLFFWTFYASNNPQKYKATQLFSTLVSIKCFLSSKSSYYRRMISEGCWVMMPKIQLWSQE